MYAMVMALLLQTTVNQFTRATELMECVMVMANKYMPITAFTEVCDAITNVMDTVFYFRIMGEYFTTETEIMMYVKREEQ